MHQIFNQRSSRLMSSIADLHSFINESIAISQPNLDASIADRLRSHQCGYCGKTDKHHTIGNIDLLHPIVLSCLYFDDFSGSRLKL